jgi:DNA polymerase-1
MLIFDIETDGFYQDVTQAHCLVIHNTETGQTIICNDQDAALFRSIESGVRMLMDAPVIAGHNVCKYDIPVLQKLYPWFKPTGEVRDTLIYARLAYPELGEIDDKLIRLCRLPPKYRGAHTLEAWGFRLGVLKSEYTGDPAIEDEKLRESSKWDRWNQTMQDYCVQDVRSTLALWNKLATCEVSAEAAALEHAVARIIARQEINGFGFDEEKAKALLVTLSVRRLQLEEDLKRRFGFWFAAAERKVFTPKRDDKKHHYTAGAAMTKVKQVYFNPGSRQHIARVLMRNFAWRPTAYTPTGEPEVSEESLKAITHPEAASLVEYLMVEKRLGQLSEGKEAWIKHVRNGRIYGSVNTMGTVTGRMAHSHPNVAQVPAVRSPYGKECRELFHAREGWKLVGADASGLELRVLAAYMAPYDGGAYVKVVTEGKKEDGTEIHTVNRKALEIDSRDDAKTWFYAFIYGAGDEKLGMIITKQRQPKKNARIGKAKRAAFLTNLPAMGKLIERIKKKAREQKWLKGLDGRRLHCRSPHSAPNTLFQSAGALVMKKALVIHDNALQASGLIPGVDYEHVANIHDEFQTECLPQHAEAVGRSAVQAIRQAGIEFGLRCPLDGEYVIGRTWADTH